jgi:membrane protease YdiL (CAAX protease family)
MTTTEAPPLHAGGDFAAALRGFGPVGLAAILLILAGSVSGPPLTALLALIWARVSRTPWRELGFVRPKSYVVTIAGGVAFGAAFKLLMKTVVMPLLGAAAVNSAFHYLAGNTAALPFALLIVIFSAGVAEEVVFRSYLFERLGKLLGQGAGARTAIVILTSAVFSAAHYQLQGWAGVEQAAITGLALGTMYAVTGRIWAVICAHAAFDVAAVAIIYFDVEAPLAHRFFG